ncbi:hypothetical protein GBA52_017245 [Prunus armeniaca]|nr:hypothetical protein GBA52_017245 [Prunus armeniaca]
MANPNSQTTQTPLIDASQTQTNPSDDDDAKLDHSLHSLETFLRLFGFCQYSFLSFSLSWLAFLLVGVALPVVLIEISYSSRSEKYQIKNFELQILVSESLVAAISLVCISYNLRKYGIRRFLFVDRYHGHKLQYRDEYIQKINILKFGTNFPSCLMCCKKYKQEKWQPQETQKPESEAQNF